MDQSVPDQKVLQASQHFSCAEPQASDKPTTLWPGPPRRCSGACGSVHNNRLSFANQAKCELSLHATGRSVIG